MIGKVFGKWIVIDEAIKEKRRSKGKHYNCECQCSTKQIITGGSLRSGSTTKCKNCLKIDTANWIGKKFGKWIVLNDTDPINTYKSFLCKCECGEERAIPATYLKRGKTKSCNPCAVKTHGKKGKSIYNIWQGIRARCYNPNEPAYHNYGGRGIKVCERWINSFENFYADMGDRPKDLQIDRINNDGDYDPSNCRWVTPKENSNNRRVSSKNRIPKIQLTIACPD